MKWMDEQLTYEQWLDGELTVEDMTEYEKMIFEVSKKSVENYSNLNKIENRKNRYMRIQKSMGNDQIKLDPSDEEFVNNYRVHRIVFENLLTERENPPEGNDRSLSIPFDEKMRPVWAPNGYGKTFAFKILSFLNVNAEEVWSSKAENTVSSYWYNFIKKCNDYLYPGNEISTGYQVPGDRFTRSVADFSENNNDLGLKNNIINKELIPFSKMKIRLVGAKRGINGEEIKQVVDILIEPDWKQFKFDDAFIESNFANIRKKFWTSESLKSPYYDVYPDRELEEILLNRSMDSENTFYEPNFISNSFHFPQAFVRFHDILAEGVELFQCQKCVEVVPWNQGNCSECGNDLESDNYYETEYDNPIETIKDEIHSVLLVYSMNFNFETITDSKYDHVQKFKIIRDQLNNNEKELIIKLGDIQEMDETEKMNLLLDFIALSKKRPSYDAMSVLPIPINQLIQVGGSDFGVICVLLDLYINGCYNQNHDLIMKNSHGRIHNHLFERFNSYFQNSSISWRTFDFLLRESESNCIEEESITEAVRSLSTIYFEIPSLVNYSSESSLKSSQQTLKDMLSLIKREFLDIKSEYPREENSQLWCQYDSAFGNGQVTITRFPYLIHDFLQIIQDRLGGGRKILDIFFRELGIPCSQSYDYLLTMMNDSNPNNGRFLTPPLTFSSESQTYLFDQGNDEDYMLDFTRPEVAKLTMLIWNFSDIYSNINNTLDQGDLTAWSAQCRFFSSDRPLKFSDPLNDIEINEKHLSFGQRSVVVSEVCLGLSVFMNPQRGLQKYHLFAEFPSFSNLQITYIFDEPEIGRSEYWVNLIARRIKSTCEYLDGEKSFMIVSHRESLLRSFNVENKYYVMQPQTPSQFEEE